MIRARPDDVARPPANVVAQLLLQCTRDDPTLVKRSRGQTRTAQTQAIQSPVMRPELGSPSILLASADPAAKQYFEDLVSIAIASSERADDLLRAAYEANRKAAHATWAFASIAAVSVAVGLAAGAAGMVGSHQGNATDNRLIEIAGEVKSLGQQQQQASRQLAAVRSEIADAHPAADDHPNTVTVQQAADAPPADNQGTIPVETLPATVARPTATQPFGATSENPVQEATYSAPWPVYHHPRRPPIRTAQRRRVPVPHFLVVFQQNLQTLFR